MYYLDFHQLYKQTNNRDRAEVRRQMNLERRNEIMARRLKTQHNQCFYCGVTITMADHLDHIIPVYYGGTNRLSNLVGACKDCNKIKLTDQIEITNPYTIASYLKIRSAHRKWLKKIKEADARGKARLKRYRPKRVQLYSLYRVDLFRGE